MNKVMRSVMSALRRGLVSGVVVGVMAVAGGSGLAACGPSGAQLRTAKAAEYKLSGKQMLDVAVQVAQGKYKLGALDIDSLAFATAQQFYTPEGMRISPNNSGQGDFVNAGGGDLALQLIVQVIETGPDRVAVTVTPKTLQFIAGSPKPRELTPDDPNLPGWVLGRANALAVEIYDAGKQYVAPPAPGS